MEGGSRVYLSRILADAGDLPGARAQAQAALDVLEARSPVRCFALAALADALRRLGAIEEALAQVDTMTLLFFELRRVDAGEALIRLTEVEVLLAAGREDAALAALAMARDRLLERAASIDDATLARSFRERVPENARTFALAAARLEGGERG
jgi:hypothetical protein